MIIFVGTKDRGYFCEDVAHKQDTSCEYIETNLHIEIDMERIEDRSKALSYIGIEIADALKSIPTPAEELEIKVAEEEPQQSVIEEQQQYAQQMTFETKPSLWQRIKNSKFVRAVRAITKIKIVLDYSDALPEGRGENNLS